MAVDVDLEPLAEVTCLSGFSAGNYLLVFSPFPCRPLGKEVTTHATPQERGAGGPVNRLGCFFTGDRSLLPSLFICSIVSLICMVSWIFTLTLGYNPILLYLFDHSNYSSFDHLPRRLDTAPSLWPLIITVAFYHFLAP